MFYTKCQSHCKRKRRKQGKNFNFYLNIFGILQATAHTIYTKSTLPAINIFSINVFTTEYQSKHLSRAPLPHILPIPLVCPQTKARNSTFPKGITETISNAFFSFLRPYLVPGDGLHLINDISLLVSRVQVGHIARIQNHRDVLHETLILDLVVGEQEDGGFALDAVLH